MRTVHQINLSSHIWNNLLNRLTHCNTVTQANINAFFKEIDEDICITHDANRTVVESHGLNETAILRALQQSTPHTNFSDVLSETYDIQVNEYIDFDEIFDFSEQIAQEDFYQNCILLSKYDSPEYTTGNMDNCNQALAA